MIEALINTIDSKSDFEDELFFSILETNDVIEKVQIIEKVRSKCKEVDRLDEFMTAYSQIQLETETQEKYIYSRQVRLRKKKHKQPLMKYRQPLMNQC